MDFGEMLRVLRRRWIIAVVGGLLTVVATLGAYKAWPNKYQVNRYDHPNRIEKHG